MKLEDWISKQIEVMLQKTMKCIDRQMDRQGESSKPPAKFVGWEYKCDQPH